MKLAIKTCTLDMPYEQMLDFCVEQKIAAIEIGTGNWSGAPHCDLDLLVSDKTAREKWYDAMRKKGLELCALNCSGNPLAYEKDMDVTKKTFELAHQLGVKKIVMMSGCPGGSAEDHTPNWIVTSWPPITTKILNWQWDEVLIPYWKKTVELAKANGIEKIALENHGCQMVYNPETLIRLRDAVGPMVGMNLDPSHLMWMGGDPVTAVHKLGADRIYHVHAKDVRIERNYIGPDGVLDTKTIDQFAKRTWNYVALGHGHDVSWWKEFLSCLSMEGYDGPISQEMEDLTMPALTGLKKSTTVLKEAMPCDL